MESQKTPNNQKVLIKKRINLKASHYQLSKYIIKLSVWFYVIFIRPTYLPSFLPLLFFLFLFPSSLPHLSPPSLLPLFICLYICVRMCTCCICAHVHVCICVCTFLSNCRGQSSEANLMELVLSFHHVGSVSKHGSPGLSGTFPCWILTLVSLLRFISGSHLPNAITF